MKRCVDIKIKIDVWINIEIKIYDDMKGRFNADKLRKII